MKPNDFLQALAAFFPGFEPVKEKADDNRGKVEDPKNDGRLSENKEKHDRIEERAERATQEINEAHGEGSKHEEEDNVKSPYERQRVDHRAWIEMPKSFDEFSAQNGLNSDPSHMKPMKPHPPKTVAPPPPAALPKEETAIRGNAFFGEIANQILGPKQATSDSARKLYQTVKELTANSKDADMKNELQRFASQVAALILRKG